MYDKWTVIKQYFLDGIIIKNRQYAAVKENEIKYYFETLNEAQNFCDANNEIKEINKEPLREKCLRIFSETLQKEEKEREIRYKKEAEEKRKFLKDEIQKLGINIPENAIYTNNGPWPEIEFEGIVFVVTQKFGGVDKNGKTMITKFITIRNNEKCRFCNHYKYGGSIKSLEDIGMELNDFNISKCPCQREK